MKTTLTVYTSTPLLGLGPEKYRFILLNLNYKSTKRVTSININSVSEGEEKYIIPINHKNELLLFPEAHLILNKYNLLTITKYPFYFGPIDYLEEEKLEVEIPIKLYRFLKRINSDNVETNISNLIDYV